MREYVVRRAFEVKNYRRVAEQNNVGYWWLRSLALDRIGQPGVDNVEKLHRFYRSLESNGKNRRR